MTLMSRHSTILLTALVAAAAAPLAFAQDSHASASAQEHADAGHGRDSGNTRHAGDTGDAADRRR